MKKLVLPIVFVISAGTTAMAQSVPVKGPSCASKVKIKAVDEGAGVFFDEECKIAYVLPPVHGHSRIDSIAGNVNIAQCVEIDDLNSSIEAYTARIKVITAKLKPVSSGSSFGPGAGGPFAGAGTNDVPVSKPLSQEDQTELKTLQDELTQLRAQRLTYNGIEGATAHFVYDLDMQGLVSRYQSANPGVHFEPLTLQRAYLSFSHKDATAAADSSAVLSMNVPGLGRLPDAPDTSALNAGTPAGPQTPDTIDATNTKIFGQSLSGNMTLSLVGICPYVNKQTGALPVKLEESSLRAHMVASVQYAYALQAFRSYRATYNLATYVSKLLENTTSGGFLSTSTVTSYVEKTKNDDWFTLETQSNDPRFYYPYLAQEIKANLTDRVLKAIAISKYGGPVPSTGLIDPQANGASVAASGLHKCPNLYCQAAGFVLDVVASFGSTSAVNSFIASNNTASHDDVTEKTMLEYYGSGGFIGDAK
jgi:hypothetical protein